VAKPLLSALLAAGFLVVFLLTPPGRVVLGWLGVVPQAAWGWVLGFAALAGFLLTGAQALRSRSR